MSFRFIILIYILCFGSFSNDDASLSWNETRKLNWDDFQSTPDASSTAVALTASGLTFGYSLKTTSRNQVIDFKAEVASYFYPKKSWYKKEKADNYILAHEQLHFDITELYARKFRKELSELKLNANIKQQFKTLNKRMNKALNATQKKYDVQSNHSINKEVQKQWEAFIYLELEKLSQYKSR